MTLPKEQLREQLDTALMDIGIERGERVPPTAKELRANIIDAVLPIFSQFSLSERIDSVKHVMTQCKFDPEDGHPDTISYNKTRQYLNELNRKKEDS